MSANEEDRTKSQPGQNPGQSLSPYQQGQQRFDQPLLSRHPPQGFAGQTGYGSQEVRGQYGGPMRFEAGPLASGPVSLRGGSRQQNDPRLGYSPYGQGNGENAGSPWGDPKQQALTAGWGQPPRHPDPQYHAWRERQNRQFDDDWDAYNRERQTSFDDAFESWRKSRASKADAVAVSDGENVASAPDAISVKDQ